MEHNTFPFGSLENLDLTNLLNSNNIVHNFPLSVIDTMVYNPFTYFHNYDNHISENLSIQYNVSEPCCEYVFSDREWQYIQLLKFICLQYKQYTTTP